jgi:hypothetical protein
MAVRGGNANGPVPGVVREHLEAVPGGPGVDMSGDPLFVLRGSGNASNGVEV